MKRDVAVKVLPEISATDVEWKLHFEREAELLASLNHSNIAHLYGLKDTGGVRALVMELVEGATLAERVTQGPIPLEEAVMLRGVQTPLNQVPTVREENQDDAKIRHMCCGIVTRGHVCVCDSSARDAFGKLVNTQGVADHSGSGACMLRQILSLCPPRGGVMLTIEAGFEHVYDDVRNVYELSSPASERQILSLVHHTHAATTELFDNAVVG